MLIKWIFLAGHLHPRENDRAASGNDIGKAFCSFKAGSCVLIDPYVDRHKVYAVLGVHLHDLDPLFGSDLF